jgi:hypothetical protein
MENQIKLGSKVRDKVTGFEGVVTAHHTYITGCDRYTVEGAPSDRWDSITFDVDRLEVVE